MDDFLAVENLSVWLPTGAHRGVDAVRRVDLTVGRGERVGIVGESGSGKSVTGRAIAGLLPTNPRVRVGGSIRIRGDELVGAPSRRWEEVRSRTVGMIFQDPSTYLNPVMTLGDQVREALPAAVRRDRAAAKAEVERILGSVGLPRPEELARRFAHELSGGMRQRVLIAIAIAKSPELIIADEPTTALDATVQRRVLDTLDEIVDGLGTSLLLISHDLSVMAHMTDRLYVMYAGVCVESGTTREVLDAPQHPYTQALIRAVRSLTDEDTELWSIPPDLRRELDALVREEATHAS